MAGIPSSPSVIFIEKDNSAYPPSVDSSIVGIVGYATKGPTDEATLITSPENLIQTFGKPDDTLIGQGLLGAVEILEATNQIRFVRGIPGDASKASTDVAFGVCPAIQFVTGTYGVDTSLYLKVNVYDANGDQVLTNQKFSCPSATATIVEGQASALAKRIGDGSITTDHVFVAFDSNSNDSGYLVAAYAGIGARLDVTSYSNSTYTTGVSALRQIELSAGTTTATPASSLSINGLGIYTSSLAYKVQALYAGTGYNKGYDSITGQTLGNSIEINSNGGVSTKLVVNQDGVTEETYQVSLLDDPTFIETVINTSVDNAISDVIQGELYYNGSALGTVTKLDILDQIRTLQSTEMPATSGVKIFTAAGAESLSGNPRFVKLVDSTYDLAGGTNGTMNSQTLGVNTSAIIGNPADKTGIYALDEDGLNLSLALIPGINADEVQNALVTVAETSQNFLAVVSPPYGLNTVQEAAEWMNGKSDVRTAALNSSWAAVYWPWVQVFDVFSAKDRWYDPAIYAVRQMVITDSVAEPWFAAAGFTRGRITKATNTEKLLNQGDRDALYASNINPVVNFSPEGVTIFGQKTAQRLTTALDRVNVRRLMIYLRKTLLASGRINVFEPNDQFTWDAVKTSAQQVLDDIKARRGITDFSVVCDATVNTPLRVDRNELWCKVLLKPTKTAEWIVFEVNLTNQSAKFGG